MKHEWSDDKKRAMETLISWATDVLIRPESWSPDKAAWYLRNVVAPYLEKKESKP